MEPKSEYSLGFRGASKMVFCSYLHKFLVQVTLRSTKHILLELLGDAEGAEDVLLADGLVLRLGQSLSQTDCGLDLTTVDVILGQISQADIGGVDAGDLKEVGPDLSAGLLVQVSVLESNRNSGVEGRIEASDSVGC